jgi:NAD dependent epimerase/dehydratase family enzyme
VAPNPVTNADFARALGQAVHRPTVLPTPLLPLKLRYGAELVETLLLASQRVRPAQLEATGYSFADASLDDAFAALL